MTMKTRSLYEIYSQIDNTNNLYTLFCLFIDCEPLGFEDVQDEIWRVIDDQLKAICKNNTWELTNLPKGHQSIGIKWVCKAKRNEIWETDHFKTKLRAKGYKKKVRIDYHETFTPMVCLVTIHLIITMDAIRWKIFQMDMKYAFLNSLLEEKVYLEEPLDYVIKGHTNRVL